MAKRILGIGMLVMVLVFGIMVWGCDNSATDNNDGGGIRTVDARLIGKWEHDSIRTGLVFTSNTMTAHTPNAVGATFRVYTQGDRLHYEGDESGLLISVFSITGNVVRFTREFDGTSYYTRVSRFSWEQ